MPINRRRRSYRRSRPSVAVMNPPRRRRARRAATARRSKHHSPAMRAKISRAVKRAMRSRKMGGAFHTRSRSRRRSFSVARRRSSYRRPVSHGLYVIKGRKLNPARRRRRFRRRNPDVMGSITSLRGLLSKDIMIMAAGAIAASVGTGFVLNRFGTSLPFAQTKYGTIAYQLAIPMAGAYFLRRRYKNFAIGLAVGGVVMAITTIMKSGVLGAGMTSVVQGPMGNFYEVKGMGLAGEIGGRRAVRGVNAYIGPKTFHTVPDAVNSPVFASGAWGTNF